MRIALQLLIGGLVLASALVLMAAVAAQPPLDLHPGEWLAVLLPQ